MFKYLSVYYRQYVVVSHMLFPSEVFAALRLDTLLECDIVCVDVNKVAPNAPDRLLHVVAGTYHAVLVLVGG